MAQTCPPDATAVGTCPATRPQRVGAPLAAGAALVGAALSLALVVGSGAVTAVVVALVAAAFAALLARRTLGHLMAGAGLRIVRPYQTGEAVLVYVPALSRVVEAEIVRVGAANTVLFDGVHTLVVANGSMLRRPPKTITQA